MSRWNSPTSLRQQWEQLDQVRYYSIISGGNSSDYKMFKWDKMLRNSSHYLINGVRNNTPTFFNSCKNFLLVMAKFVLYYVIIVIYKNIQYYYWIFSRVETRALKKFRFMFCQSWNISNPKIESFLQQLTVTVRDFAVTVLVLQLLDCNIHE
jgi:hypothetical protein